jgi:hypothetical protein
VDAVYARCAPPGARRLALREFLGALAALADEAGSDFADVRDAVCAAATAAQPAAGARAEPPPPAGELSGPAGVAAYPEGAPTLASAARARGDVQVSNPLFEATGPQQHPQACGSGRGSHEAAPGPPAGGGAIGALLARLEALEADAARRQQQLDAVVRQQAQLAAEVRRLAGGGGSDDGSASPPKAAARQLAGQVAALERAVEELRQERGGEAAAARVERKAMVRQARIETALMQVRGRAWLVCRPRLLGVTAQLQGLCACARRVVSQCPLLPQPTLHPHTPPSTPAHRSRARSTCSTRACARSRRPHSRPWRPSSRARRPLGRTLE